MNASCTRATAAARPAPAPPHLATAEMLAHYEENGYLYCPAVLSDVQVAAGLAAADFAYTTPQDAINLRPDDGTGLAWMRQRTYQWHKTHPIFVDLLIHPLVMDIGKAVLGADVHAIAAQVDVGTPCH